MLDIIYTLNKSRGKINHFVLFSKMRSVITGEEVKCVWSLRGVERGIKKIKLTAATASLKHCPSDCFVLYFGGTETFPKT